MPWTLAFSIIFFEKSGGNFGSITFVVVLKIKKKFLDCGIAKNWFKHHLLSLLFEVMSPLAQNSGLEEREPYRSSEILTNWTLCFAAN